MTTTNETKPKATKPKATKPKATKPPETKSPNVPENTLVFERNGQEIKFIVGLPEGKTHEEIGKLDDNTDGDALEHVVSMAVEKINQRPDVDLMAETQQLMEDITRDVTNGIFATQ